MDAFGVGGLIAVLARDQRAWQRLERIAPIGLALTGIALAVMFLSVSPFYPSHWVVVTLGHSLLAAAFGCLTVLALRQAAPAWLQHPVMRALGKYSYGIYVWHWPLQRLLLVEYARIGYADRVQGALQALAFVAVCCGWVSYYVIESSFLRLKRLFAYSSQPEATTASRMGPEDFSR